jgi:hypothetical protein
MSSRSFLLLFAVFFSPAWSQEPSAEQPVATLHSFDLNSDSIKQIVRDTAAGQSVPVQISEEKSANRDGDTRFKYVPPVATQTAKEPAPRRPTAPPKADGPVSTLIETLVDMALGVEDDSLEYRTSCPPTDALNTPAPNYENCQLVSR